jgi:hypothetical protein
MESGNGDGSIPKFLEAEKTGEGLAIAESPMEVEDMVG